MPKSVYPSFKFSLGKNRQRSYVPVFYVRLSLLSSSIVILCVPVISSPLNSCHVATSFFVRCQWEGEMLNWWRNVGLDVVINLLSPSYLVHIFKSKSIWVHYSQSLLFFLCSSFFNGFYGISQLIILPLSFFLNHLKSIWTLNMASNVTRDIIWPHVM